MRNSRSCSTCVQSNGNFRVGSPRTTDYASVKWKFQRETLKYEIAQQLFFISLLLAKGHGTNEKVKESEKTNARTTETITQQLDMNFFKKGTMKYHKFAQLSTIANGHFEILSTYRIRSSYLHFSKMQIFEKGAYRI